jgi:hypothetical protein
LSRNSSWPGFVPAIHVSLDFAKDVDARHKAGHDEKAIHFQAIREPEKIAFPVIR